MSNYQWIREHHKVPAEYGRIVVMDSQKKGVRRGIIVEDMGNYIGVLFDDKKPTEVEVCHPTWALTYTDETELPRKMTKSQQRYRKYLEVADCFNSFKDFLRSPSAL